MNIRIKKKLAKKNNIIIKINKRNRKYSAQTELEDTIAKEDTIAEENTIASIKEEFNDRIRVDIDDKTSEEELPYGYKKVQNYSARKDAERAEELRRADLIKGMIKLEEKKSEEETR